jgi:hypothetical protein
MRRSQRTLPFLSLLRPVSNSGGEDSNANPAGSGSKPWNPLETMGGVLVTGVVLTIVLSLMLKWWMGA